MREPATSGAVVDEALAPSAGQDGPPASTDPVELSASLEAARARLLRRAALERAARIVRLGTGGALALATVRALAPAFDLRGATLIAALALATWAWLASRVRRCALDDEAVAAALQAADAQTRRAPIADELRSLLELERARRAGRLSGGDGFLVLLSRRVGAGLGTLVLDEALPLGEARRGLRRALAIAGLGLVASALVAPHLWPGAWAALRHGTPADAVPPAPPIVGDLELELTPPPYTGLPPRALPASNGELRALRGTQVHVRARSLGRAVRAELLVEADGGKTKRLPVNLSSTTAAAPQLDADFAVDAPGRYRFVLWRWTGRTVEPEAHLITIEPDLPPRVELRVPADPLELAVPRPIELAIDAEDDFGLGTVALVYRIGDGAPVRVPLALEQLTPRRARGRTTWETGELEREAPLPPGAKVTYFIEAADNDAVSGTKIGRSRTATLTFRTPVKPATVDRVALEALVEATLQTLADRLEKVGAPEPHGALVALVARFQQVTSAAAQATPALRKLAADIGKRLDKLAADESARGAAVAGAIEAELERAVLALDDLRGRRRLDDMVRIGQDMKRARDELTRLMSELKSATSADQKARLRQEIERKLVELEAKMAELRRASHDAEGEVPDEFLNKDAIAKQQMKNQTDSIRDLLARGDLDKALGELDRMSRSLDQLTSSLEKSQRAQGESSDPAAAKALSALESELADLAKEERDVEHEARALRDQAGTKNEALQALRDKLRPRLEELDRRLAAQSDDGRLVDREDLERTRGRARSIGRALEADDLDEAQGMALDTRRLAQGTSTQLHQLLEELEAEAQARVGSGPTPAHRRAERHAAEAEQLAREIESELQKAEGQRAPQLGAEAKQRLEELARRQQQLQQKGEALQKQLGQEPGLQGMPREIGQAIDGAKQQIAESGRQLGRQSPGRGADAAQQAAQQLDAARQQVAQARKGGDRNEQDGPSHERDEPVRIPGADDSQAPRAFREELLDAMKRGAPKRFEEQVQRYYEELVR